MKKLCSARVVSENAFEMLKGRWRLLYKKCKCKLYNTKHVTMAAVLFHNICIYQNGHCKLRKRLDVKYLELDIIMAHFSLKPEIVSLKALKYLEK